ncbi:MAG: TetR/AcrR family transcriptional regulator [Antricoccus sp.]
MSSPISIATATTGRVQNTRAAATKGAILDAASVVFIRDGYVESSIAAIVEAAGTSVGSLYHHFSGKAEVFVAAFERFADQAATAAGAAVALSRAGGNNDPVALFAAGARGYLIHCRRFSALTQLFMFGDGPPGFGALRRRTDTQWVGRNAKLLGKPGRSSGYALVQVLTTVCASAGREVAQAATETEATELIEEFCALLVKIADH